MGHGRVEVCQKSILMTSSFNYFIAIWKEGALNNIFQKYFISGIFLKLLFSPANLQNWLKSVFKLKKPQYAIKTQYLFAGISNLCFCILLSPSLKNNIWRKGELKKLPENYDF